MGDKVKHKPHHGKWRIESSTDMVTGARTWRATPPRWVYKPAGKRSFDTYDEALAHVWDSKGRRSMVFPSKTFTGQWFWRHVNGPEILHGWEQDHETAVLNALGEPVDA